jgi:hypothetical protein
MPKDSINDKVSRALANMTYAHHAYADGGEGHRRHDRRR